MITDSTSRDGASCPQGIGIEQDTSMQARGTAQNMCQDARAGSPLPTKFKWMAVAGRADLLAKAYQSSQTLVGVQGRPCIQDMNHRFNACRIAR